MQRNRPVIFIAKAGKNVFTDLIEPFFLLNNHLTGANGMDQELNVKLNAFVDKLGIDEVPMGMFYTDTKPETVFTPPVALSFFVPAWIAMV